jgi:hypothetical protein
MICFKILLLISCRSVEFIYRKRLPTFAPTILGNKWILLSPKTIFELDKCFHYRSNSYRFGITCFDDNSACNNNYCSRQGMILHKSNYQEMNSFPLAIKTYGCFHPCFETFLIFCVHASVAHHQQTSLVPSMFIFYYKQRMLIALQHAQVITILQHVATLNHEVFF